MFSDRINQRLEFQGALNFTPALEGALPWGAAEPKRSRLKSLAN